MAVMIIWIIVCCIAAIPCVSAAYVMQRAGDTISALFMCALAAFLLFFGALPLLIGS